MFLYMRVVCVQPIIENAKLSTTVLEDSLGSESYLSGYISPSQDIPLSHLSRLGYRSQFKCLRANRDSDLSSDGLGFIESRKPAFSICPLSYENGVTSPLGNYNKAGAVYVILDHTDFAPPSTIPIPDFTDWTAHGDGIWTRLDINMNTTQFSSLRVTMCFDSR